MAGALYTTGGVGGARFSTQREYAIPARKIHWCSCSFTYPHLACALTDHGPFPMLYCNPVIVKSPTALEPLLQFSLTDAPRKGVKAPPPRLTVTSSPTLVVDGPSLGFTQSAPSEAEGRM